MPFEASRAKALEAAARLPRLTGDASESLRAEAVAFCTALPEPPVYRRRDDPSRAEAAKLIAPGEALLARAYQTGDEAWTAALEGALTFLHHVADGRVELAEVAWFEARRLESKATGKRKLYALSDEDLPPVFDPATRQSRFDPRPERTLNVKLPCPSCRKVREVSFSPRVASHTFACTHCAAEWVAYFAELRTVEIDRRSNKRTYSFRLNELSGHPTRIEVEDASSGELQVARGDLLAFLYMPRSVLRGVLNLNSSRVLWLAPGGPCFVATVAFGAEAPELDVLRRFRDRALMRSPLGRAFVDAYYQHGPQVAGVVSRRRWLRAPVARALSAVVRVLERTER